MSRPPNILIPGRGRGRNVPKGFILGRVSAGRGPVELLNSSQLGQLGVVSAAAITNAVNTLAGYSKFSMAVDAGTTLTAGLFVSITSTGLKKADKTSGLVAHGFVIAGYAPGAIADVYTIGAPNTFLSSLSIGTDYYVGSAGAVGLGPANGSGLYSQYLGTAYSTTALVYSNVIMNGPV